MYLAHNVAGWSTTRIGRFYNGRHHTTVIHGIQKIELLRQTDDSVDALIDVLTAALNPGMDDRFSTPAPHGWPAALVDAVTDRVLQEIRHRTMDGKIDAALARARTNTGIAR